jgi:hypothetical protein
MQEAPHRLAARVLTLCLLHTYAALQVLLHAPSAAMLTLRTASAAGVDLQRDALATLLADARFAAHVPANRPPQPLPYSVPPAPYTSLGAKAHAPHRCTQHGSSSSTDLGSASDTATAHPTAHAALLGRLRALDTTPPAELTHALAEYAEASSAPAAHGVGAFFVRALSAEALLTQRLLSPLIAAQLPQLRLLVEQMDRLEAHGLVVEAHACAATQLAPDVTLTSSELNPSPCAAIGQDVTLT